VLKGAIFLPASFNSTPKEGKNRVNKHTSKGKRWGKMQSIDEPKEGASLPTLAISSETRVKRPTTDFPGIRGTKGFPVLQESFFD